MTRSWNRPMKQKHKASWTKDDGNTRVKPLWQLTYLASRWLLCTFLHYSHELRPVHHTQRSILWLCGFNQDIIHEDSPYGLLKKTPILWLCGSSKDTLHEDSSVLTAYRRRPRFSGSVVLAKIFYTKIAQSLRPTEEDPDSLALWFYPKYSTRR